VRIASSLGPGSVVSLEGTLGAGKTTLAKGIIRGLGVTETVTSPTFTIISEYSGRLPVYHMDLYRIEESEELYHLGIDEYLYGDGVSLIEWIDRLPEPPGNLLRIHLEVLAEGSSRRISLSGTPAETVI
jgi:tRNA threonylcarbamoyladenosine biosynthesis protein TsaE